MRHLLDLLVPSHCDGCGARAQPPWCASCDDAVVALRPTVPCPRCAGQDDPGHPCWAPGSQVQATVALTSWTGAVTTALVRAKLDGRAEVFRALGPALASCAQHLPVDVVVPVPTDARRARRRGVDHTAVLARAVARELRLPCLPALRAVGRQPDRGSARAQRPEPGSSRADGVVALARPDAVAGRAVLLVDDLVTTGATLGACAGPLADGGAAWVGAAVLARAGRHTLRAEGAFRV